MGLIIKKLVGELAEPIADVTKNVSDNVTRVKISNNELKGKVFDNRLAAYQTRSNNQLTKFVSAVTATQNIISCITSAITAGVDAYARIQISHDQVRITQLQSDSYVQGKREETEQVRIAQREETLRCLAGLHAELEAKKLEFAKFEAELNESRQSREFKQEQWRRKVNSLEMYLHPLIDYANKVRDEYYASGFTDEKRRAEVERVEESLQVYIKTFSELYA